MALHRRVDQWDKTEEIGFFVHQKQVIYSFQIYQKSSSTSANMLISEDQIQEVQPL